VQEHYPLSGGGGGALILRPGFIYGDKPVPVPGAGIFRLPLGWIGRCVCVCVCITINININMHSELL